MELRTLGGLELLGSQISRPTPLLLLTFLALEGSRDRRYLAELFWPQAANSLGSLSQVLSQIRRGSPEVLEADSVRLQSLISTDAQAFLAAAQSGDYQKAQALYQGPFLEGLSLDWGVELEEWIYAKREYLAAQMREVLLRLAEAEAAKGQLESAASYAEQAYLLRFAPEPSEEDFSRCHALLGPAGHPLAKEVAREAQGFGVKLEPRPTLFVPPPDKPLPPNPYKGLAYFEEGDAAHFFGRERFSRQLVEATEQEPHVVAVVGPSGSGKSSVVFAGMVPLLRSKGWLIAACRPGRQPFLSLALALQGLLEHHGDDLSKLTEASDLARDLQSQRRSLADTIQQIQEDHTDKPLLLIIDQFEELYTMSEAEGLAERFEARLYLDQLIQACRLQKFGLVLTIRADFMASVLEYRPFVNLLQASQYLLGPMDQEELRAVIEAPAEQLGVSLEEGLTERILNEVANQEGSLPMLEFALSQLWERQQKGKLSHATYDAIGGVEEALANHAEAVYQHLSVDERMAAQHVFLQLVYPGLGKEDTRRVASKQELGADWALSSKLASAPSRLLVINQEEGTLTAELIHEALIRRWSRLHQWLNEHRAFRVWQERLRQDLRLWQNRKEDEGTLLRGFHLEEARQMLSNYTQYLNDGERRFIDASLGLRAREEAEALQQQMARLKAQQDRERLRRRVTQVLASALVVALLLSGTAIYQWRLAGIQHNNAQLARQEAETAQQEAEVERDRAAGQARLALSRQLGVQALTAAQLPSSANGYYDRALLLANEAVALADRSLESHGQLLRVFQTLPRQLEAFLWRSDSAISGLAFSPGGEMLAGSSESDQILLWKLQGQTPQANLQGQKEGIRSLAFSPDGTLLASGGKDGSIILFESASQDPLGEPLQGHSDEIMSIAFSPDGSLLGSGSRDGTIVLWEVASRNKLGVLSREQVFPVASIAFSPDGKTLASGNRDNSVIFWDVASQSIIGQPLKEHGDQVRSVAFSPDGKLLASGARDGVILLWDVVSQTLSGEPLEGHRGEVRSVAFSPDGSTLASGAGDSAIILWDLATGQPLGEALKGHSSEVRMIAFSPDGKLLASGSSDGTVILWDIKAQSSLAEPLVGHSGEVWSVAFSPDSKTLASGGNDGSILLWNVTSPQSSIQLLASQQGQILTLAMSPDGQLLANGGRDGLIHLWDLASKKSLAELKGHSDWVRSLAFSPDGQLLASGSRDGTVILWSLETRSMVTRLEAHSDWVWTVVFSPDGKTLASSSSDNSIILWDVASQKQVEVLQGHNDWVTALAFNPSGTELLSGGRDGNIIRWDLLDSPISSSSLISATAWVQSLSFSPDGQLVASGFEDGNIILWDSVAGIPLSEPLRSDGTEVSSLSFSPDGQVLASGSRGGLNQLWTLGLIALQDKACGMAGRALTLEEWQRYFGERDYHPVCGGSSS